MGVMSELNLNTDSVIMTIFLLLILFVVLAVMRGARNRQILKQVKEDRIASQKREKSLKAILNNEQEEAARRIALQNKTFELYEHVRQQGNKTEDSDQ